MAAFGFKVVVPRMVSDYITSDDHLEGTVRSYQKLRYSALVGGEELLLFVKSRGGPNAWPACREAVFSWLELFGRVVLERS